MLAFPATRPTMPLETETRNIETETTAFETETKTETRSLETETGLETLTSLIQGHRIWHQSKGHKNMRLPISDQ